MAVRAAGADEASVSRGRASVREPIPLKRAGAVAAIMVALWAPGCYGQAGPTMTINPVMSKGPAAAPVTIVEFSDYQ